MSGGVFIRFAVGRLGASAAHVRYITRPGADGRAERPVATYRLPDEARAGADEAERRETLIAYAAEREAAERDRADRDGRGVGRTHYRLVLSCEGRVGDERMHALVGRYLEREFPAARAVSAVHQDTAHTHAHVWLDARGVDGRKLHFDGRAYRRLDEAWVNEYARAFGPEKEAEHLARKAETRAWRAAARRARAEGRPAPPAPQRAGGRPAREERDQTAAHGRPRGDRHTGQPDRDTASHAAGAERGAGEAATGSPPPQRGARSRDDGARRRAPTATAPERAAGAGERLGEASLAALRTLATAARRPLDADRALGGADAPTRRGESPDEGRSR